MRRKDRKITDKFKIKEFLSKQQIIRIAFYDNDIYIVPVNYGYYCKEEQDIFYFHGAKEGRKFELSKENPKVGFEIDGNYSLLKNEIACKFSVTFQSVVGTGKISIIEEKEEKVFALNTIMKQVTQQEEWSYSDNMLDNVAIFKLEVEKMSCKARN